MLSPLPYLPATVAVVAVLVAEIIGHAVWQYHLFNLSLSDVEMILAERDIVVTMKASGIGAARNFVPAAPAAAAAT